MTYALCATFLFAATIRTLLTIQRDYPMPPYNGEF